MTATEDAVRSRARSHAGGTSGTGRDDPVSLDGDGVDRLVMNLTRLGIRDTILFPITKPT